MLGSLLLLAAVLAAEPPAPPRTIEIAGRVLDAQGNPAGRVPVELHTLSADEPRARTTTNSDGRFRLSAPEAGMYRIAVRAPGAPPMERTLLPLLSDVALPPLRLAPADVVRVRILGADGKPRAGIRVGGWRRGTSPTFGLSDESGVIVLSKERGEALQIAAMGGGHAESRLTRTEGGAVDVRLAAGCPRRLIVRDANGQPVAGVSVANDLWALGTTDADGAFTAVVPCRKESRLSMEAADGRAAAVALRPDESAPAEVVLSAPRRHTGRVLDAETRAPLAGAFVWPASDPSAFVRTDAKGAYSLAIPEAAAEIRAAAAGHLPGADKSTGSTSFALQPTAVLAGKVVDAEGTPVAEAELETSDWNPDSVVRFRPRTEGLSWRAVSGADGGFRIEVLPRRSYTIEAFREGLAPASITVSAKILPAAVVSGLKIVLRGGSSVSGRLLDRVSSQPVPAAKVRLIPITPEDSLPRFMRLDAEEKRDFGTFSEGDGTFRVDHLAAGRYEVRIEADGFSPRKLSGITLESGGSPAELGEIALDRGLTLEGIVVDRDERPLADATVMVLPPSQGGTRPDILRRMVDEADIRETVSGADGRFAVTGLAEGEAFDVTGRKAGYVPATLSQVQLPSPDSVRLVLETAARVSGNVKSDQGDPVAGAVVVAGPADSALPAAMTGEQTQSDGSGAFALDHLSPGRITLRAMAKGYTSLQPVVLDVRKGESVDGVELVLGRGAAIEGTVLTPTGQPATSARVTVRHATTPDQLMAIEIAGSARTNGDGRYRLEGVATGPQTLIATQEGYLRGLRDLDVRPGENRLDFRLGEGASVSGRVVDEGGRPVAGSAVSLIASRPGSGREGTSDTDGSFRFSGVEPGSYSLAAHREGYSPGREQVTVANSPVDGIELRLQQGGGVIAGRILGLAPQELPRVQISALKRPLDTLDGTREGHADSQGGYRIEGVFPGNWTVSARSASGRQVRVPVAFPEGGGELPLDLDFGQGVTLSGSVHRRGEPVAAAKVEASGTSGTSYGSAITGGGGAFRIEGLEAGEHRVVVTIAQSGLRNERVVALGTDQTIEIDLPTARAGGQVIDAATQAPMAGVTVVANTTGTSAPSSFQPRATSGTDGRFVLDGLGKGDYRIAATRDGYAEAAVPVTLGSDDSTVDNVRLLLEPEQGLVLQLASTFGIVPSGIAVALLDGNGQVRYAQVVSTGEGGRARIASAPGGSFLLLVAAAGSATASLPVTVPGSPVPVTLTRGARLAVDVPELAGKGGTASLTLVGADGQPFRSLSRGVVQQQWPVVDGSATVDGLPAGNWRAVVTGANGALWQATTVLGEGEEGRLVVR